MTILYGYRLDEKRKFTVDIEDDYFGSSATIEAKIKSLKDASESTSLYFDIDILLSGYLNLLTSNLELECSLGGSIDYTFNIRNDNTGIPLITYFSLEGVSTSTATNWISFIDEDDNTISRSEPISMTPGAVEKITLRLSIPENEKLSVTENVLNIYIIEFKSVCEILCFVIITS